MSELIELLPLPKDTFSESAAWQAAACTQAWKRQHIDKEPRRAKGKMILGAAIADAQNFANQEQLAGRPRPSADRIHQDYRAALDLAIAKTEQYGLGMKYENDDTKEKLVDDGCKLLALYESMVGRQLVPLLSEWKFEREFPDVAWRLTGRIDLYYEKEGRFILADGKVTAKRKNIQDLMTSGQFTTYQGALEEAGYKVDQIEFHNLVRPSPKFPAGRFYVIPMEPRTPEQIQRRLENHNDRILQLRLGRYPTADDWKVCSGCDYLETCRPEWAAVKEALAAEKKRAKEED